MVHIRGDFGVGINNSKNKIIEYSHHVILLMDQKSPPFLVFSI